MFFTNKAVSRLSSWNAISRRGVAQSTSKYDLIVIGGGSGGLSTAKRAAGYGAKVCIVEGAKYGGTCVNAGCVPKKVMFNAAHVSEVIREAKHFGFTTGEVSLNWGELKKSRDAYISRLNKIYENGLDKMSITRKLGFASFENSSTIRVGDELLSADHIIISSGSKSRKLGIEGEEYTMDSNGFFALEKQPKKVAIVGGGYIAVELAGVFNTLGTSTTIFARDGIVNRFDTMLANELTKSMTKAGVSIENLSILDKVIKYSDDNLAIKLTDGKV